MKATGIAVFVVAAVIYVQAVRSIWRMVAEARQIESGIRFNRFWWTPAWRLHSIAFPSSPLRRQIVSQCVTIGILAAVCLFLIAWADMHSLGWFAF